MATVTIPLRTPIARGTEELHELMLKPSGRALRDLTIRVDGDGSIHYEPHRLAVVGLRMAGIIAGAEKVVDEMTDLGDLSSIAQAVLGFFEPPPEAGKTP